MGGTSGDHERGLVVSLCLCLTPVSDQCLLWIDKARTLLRGDWFTVIPIYIGSVNSLFPGGKLEINELDRDCVWHISCNLLCHEWWRQSIPVTTVYVKGGWSFPFIVLIIPSLSDLQLLSISFLTSSPSPDGACRAEQGATCSPLDHNAGEVWRRRLSRCLLSWRCFNKSSVLYWCGVLVSPRVSWTKERFS
jgi:hypothetical protein